jgi:hypothetical protein
VLHLVSSLPEVRALTVQQRLASLDMDVEANLPTNYAILKLYFGAVISILMFFWYREDEKKRRGASHFWWLAAAILFFMGLDESAQLHEIWGAGIATKLFGDALRGNQYTIFPYAILLGSFYLCSLTLFPKHSKTVFFLFVGSGLSFIVSQLGEWSFRPGVQLMNSIFGLFGSLSESIHPHTQAIAWEEGLELFGYTLMVNGVVWGIGSIHQLQGHIDKK